jgi:hypothetical protein
MELEQKEQNKNFILANLDKYIIDGHNNFIHIGLELGDKNYYIENYKVNDFEEVKKKIIESITKDKSK